MLTAVSTRLRSSVASVALFSTVARPPSVLSIQSHVVYGHAGNSAATFPLRRLGVNVWPLNTVHFSNHTQYPEGWTGSPMPPESIGEVVRGLDSVGQLSRCDAVLSGYIGSAEQGSHILDAVRAVKAANPSAIYASNLRPVCAARSTLRLTAATAHAGSGPSDGAPGEGLHRG